VDGPVVEMSLERPKSLVEGLAHLGAAELVEVAAIDSFDEAGGCLWLLLCSAMRVAVQIEVEFVGGGASWASKSPSLRPYSLRTGQ
jgi:hypothetical protein